MLKSIDHRTQSMGALSSESSDGTHITHPSGVQPTAPGSTGVRSGPTANDKAVGRKLRSDLYKAKQTEFEATRLKLQALFDEKKQFRGANGMDAPFYLAALNHKYPGLNARLISHPVDLIEHLNDLKKQQSEEPRRERAMLATGSSPKHYVACDLYATVHKICADVVDSVSANLARNGLEPWLRKAQNEIPGFDGAAIDFTPLDNQDNAFGCAVFSPHAAKRMWREQETRNAVHESKEPGKINNNPTDAGKSFSPGFFKLMQAETREIQGDQAAVVTKKPGHNEETLAQRKARVFQEFTIAAGDGATKLLKINTSLEKQRVHLYRDIGEFYDHINADPDPLVELEKALDFVLPFLPTGWDDALPETRALKPDWDSTATLEQISKLIVPEEKKSAVAKELLNALPTWRSALLREQGIGVVTRLAQGASPADAAAILSDLLSTYQTVWNEGPRLDKAGLLGFISGTFANCKENLLSNEADLERIRQPLLQTMEKILEDLPLLQSSLQQAGIDLLKDNIDLVPEGSVESLLHDVLKIYVDLPTDPQAEEKDDAADLSEGIEETLYSLCERMLENQSGKLLEMIATGTRFPAELEAAIIKSQSAESDGASSPEPGQ